MKEIKLNKGHIAFVDDEDFERVNRFHWYAKLGRHSLYAIHDICNGKNKKRIYMHRYVLKLDTNKEPVDHINRNGLDNQKTNLRLVDFSKNGMNRIPNIGRKFKGVFKRRKDCNYSKPYMSRIVVRGKKIYLGYFKTPEEAAHAYDIAALKYCMDYNKLNFPLFD